MCQRRVYEMPFGKFQGTPLDKVPHGYLRWLWARSEPSCLRQMIDKVLRGEVLPDERTGNEIMNDIIATMPPH